MVDLRRVRFAVAASAFALALAGCSSESDASSDASDTEPTASETNPGQGSGEWGSYPADTSLDEREAGEAYVDALGSRDGARFCSVLVPWISGRFDIYGTDPDASFSHPVRCPEFVSAFIGYTEDCCAPEFVGAAVADVGELDRRGDVVGVPITVTLTLKRESSGPYEKSLEDIVWLTQNSGAWRVAKLSEAAASASIALPAETRYDLSETGSDVPPDVAADRRAFDAEVAKTETRRRQYEQSFRRVMPRATCTGAARYPDASRDVVDYRHPAPPTPTPQLRAADLRAVETYSRNGRICVVFEMAGEIRRDTTFTVSHESADVDWSTTGLGFAQFFEVDLREDGRARVTSGRDSSDRTLSVPATVGLDGSRLLLVLDKSSFAAGRPAPASRAKARLLERFKFIASVTVRLSEKRHLHDDLGPGPPGGIRRYVYPPR